MAYFSQENKKLKAEALKSIIPKGWKYSLAIKDHRSIVLTISSAPVDLLAEAQEVSQSSTRPSHISNIENFPDRAFNAHLPLFKQIIDALNAGNHDNSDAQTDYFDVGWYVDVQVGKWDKPFIFKENIVLKNAVEEVAGKKLPSRGRKSM